MNGQRMLELGQQWPDSYSNNKYWIGANPRSSSTQHSDGLLLLGRECTSISELESVAEDIRADLDRALDEARKKLTKRSK